MGISIQGPLIFIVGPPEMWVGEELLLGGNGSWSSLPSPFYSPESRLSQARGLALVVELGLCVLSWGFPPGLLSHGLGTLLARL